MIALTAAVLPTFSAVRTWQDFAQCLLNIHTVSGLSCSDLEKLSRNSDRELKRSTVSDALNGKRRITKPLLESLLEAGKLPAAEPIESMIVWLDELHRFLGSSPPLTRTVVNPLKNAGSIVVGTLWSDDCIARTELRQTNAAERLLALLTAGNSHDPHAVAEVVRLPASGLHDGRTLDRIGTA